MKRSITLFAVLTTTLTPGFSQKLLLTGGYTRVGENSFSGVPFLGLHAVFPLGQYFVADASVGTGFKRQAYQEFIPSLQEAGGQTITAYHNHLHSLQGFLAGRFAATSHLEVTLGPSAGFYIVEARERSDELKPGFGLWSNLTYKHLGGSRFNLEAVFHPKTLLRSMQVEDADFRFDEKRLFVWDAQVGVSYDLKR
jgi:hypothetical protein